MHRRGLSVSAHSNRTVGSAVASGHHGRTAGRQDGRMAGQTVRGDGREVGVDGRTDAYS